MGAEMDAGAVLVAAAVGAGPCPESDAAAVDRWVGRVAALAARLVPVQRSIACSAGDREIELTGVIQEVVPRIVRHDGSPGNLAQVKFCADQGRQDYPFENLWVDLTEAGSAPLVAEAQRLTGVRVRVRKRTRRRLDPTTGQPEERGHGYLVWLGPNGEAQG